MFISFWVDSIRTEANELIRVCLYEKVREYVVEPLEDFLGEDTAIFEFGKNLLCHVAFISHNELLFGKNMIYNNNQFHSGEAMDLVNGGICKSFDCDHLVMKKSYSSTSSTEVFLSIGALHNDLEQSFTNTKGLLQAIYNRRTASSIQTRNEDRITQVVFIDSCTLAFMLVAMQLLCYQIQGKRLSTNELQRRLSMLTMQREPDTPLQTDSIVAFNQSHERQTAMTDSGKGNQSKDSTSICVVLKLLREARGMSGKELAEKMGISGSFISDVENKRKRPSLDMLGRYSEALGIPLSTIMYFSDDFKGKNYGHEEMLLKILLRLVERRKTADGN